MCERPSPHNARRAASAKAAPNRFPQVNLSKTEDTDAALDFQARSPLDLQIFCLAHRLAISAPMAASLAPLIWGVCAR